MHVLLDGLSEEKGLGVEVTGDLNATFGHCPIYTPRRFYIFMRRTTISHFSFLISHSIEAFIHNQGVARPVG